MLLPSTGVVYVAIVCFILILEDAALIISSNETPLYYTGSDSIAC
ncbi:hypothetical protein EVA_16794 [gut metagenome]|uniref:Uncharacterized protein n=1 Tax=gut metagenome TaxID=749906 RepID=J9G6J6_9ZZZZ